MRPSCIVTVDGLVVLRGEETMGRNAMGLATAEIDLTSKMRKWNPLFYGELPYIMGFATDRTDIIVVAIDRYLQTYTVLRHLSTSWEALVKVFYNMAQLFILMDKLSNRSAGCQLLPFSPRTNGNRTVELLDTRLYCVYVKSGEDVRFTRLCDIYETLNQLKAHLQYPTCLPVVKTLLCYPGELRVLLGPLGYEKVPEFEVEVLGLVFGVMIALNHWHGANYCHGDIRWQNIVFVSDCDGTLDEDVCHYMLIHTDNSHRPNTKIIDWTHPFEGMMLAFQHDLYQVGRLFDRITCTLSDELKEIRDLLLSAPQNSTIAKDIMAHPLLKDMQQAIEFCD